MHSSMRITLALCVALFLSNALANKLPSNVMPSSQIKSGMRGYGLSVFKGNTIEKFDVLVLGVLPKWNTGKPYILIKMNGGPITNRNANVMGGMSGSPVIINGKYVGAVAAGFSFPKEPLALVTPLDAMLEAWDPKLPKEPQFTKMPSRLSDNAVIINGKAYKAIAFDDETPSNPELTLSVKPYKMPVMVSGLSQRGIKRLAEMIEPLGLEPIAAPGGSGAVKTADIKPGAPVGMSLAFGDIDITGIGTLTYRNGDKIVAFGHPMLQIGPVETAMVSANIVDIYPSYYSSQKMGVAGKIIGTINQDTAWCISGTVGKMPTMIPITVTVNDRSLGKTKVFKTSIMNHPLMSYILALIVTSESIYNVRNVPGETTARIKYTVDTDKTGPITRSNIVYAMDSIEVFSVMEMIQLVSSLQSNPWEKVNLKSINLDVTLDNINQSASILRAYPKYETYKPGETVELNIVMQQDRKPEFNKTVSIPLPKNLPNGRYQIQISSGGIGGRMGLFGSSSNQGQFAITQVENIKQLVDRFLEGEKGNELIVRLLLNTPKIWMGGVKMETAPSKLADAMRTPSSTVIAVDRDDIKIVEGTDWVLSGGATATINVMRKDSALSAPGILPPPSPLPQPPPQASPGQMARYEDDYNNEFIMTSTFNNPIELFSSTKEKEAKKNANITATNGASANQAEPPITPPAATVDTPKSLTRQLALWKDSGFESFYRGTHSGTSVSSTGWVTAGWSDNIVGSVSAPIALSVAMHDNMLYVGTGHKGEVFRLEGKTFKRIAQIDDFEITAFCSTDVGLFAASSPKGQIVKIKSDGTTEKLADTGKKYILALDYHNGKLYAGTGYPAAVLEIALDGKVKTLFQCDENHITAITVSNDGTLYAGTSDNGIVYKITSDGKPELVLDTPQTTISGLAIGKIGVIAGTAPMGSLWAISPNGQTSVLRERLDRPVKALTELPLSDGGVVAVCDGQTWRIDSKGDMFVYTAEKTFTVLSTVADSNKLVVGSANAGEVHVMTAPDFDINYVSAVHEAKRLVAWSKIMWTYVNGTGKATFQTRTGNTPEPDETWSNWSEPYIKSGAKISSPVARYVQYKINFSDTSNKTAIEEVVISYRTENQAPVLKVLTPNNEDAIGKTFVFRWQANDPDGDTLDYDVLYSTDKGKTWTSVETPENAAAKSNSAQISRNPMREWDTTKVADGDYWVKIVASDKPSNGKEAKTIDKLLTLHVVNQAPDLEVKQEDAKPNNNGGYTITGVARQSTATIAGVQYRINNGPWITADAEDGLFDSGFETFTFMVESLNTGENNIEVQAINTAAAASSVTLKLTK